MKQYWSNNRESLFKALPKGTSGVVIAGNGLVSRTASANFAFRQESNMLYLCGMRYPGLVLLGDVLTNSWYLVLPKFTKTEIIFDDVSNLADQAKAIGLANCITRSEAMAKIADLSKRGDIYFNLAPKKKIHGVYSNPARTDWHLVLRRHGVMAKDIRPIVANLRMIKQAYEIENIQKAVAITKDIINKSTKSVECSTSITEQMVANRITADFYGRGVEHAYLPIIASGSNAAVVHHMPDDSFIRKNQTLLYDVGAEFNGYAADISRTVVVGDNSFLQQLIDDVTAVQDQLIGSLKPGVLWPNIQQQARQLLSEIVNKHDLLKYGTLRELFPYAVGHFLGLEVHDVGDYKQPLQENMVITIEPGLHSKTAGFGIRIEDDVLITKTGAKKID